MAECLWLILSAIRTAQTHSSGLHRGILRGSGKAQHFLNFKHFAYPYHHAITGVMLMSQRDLGSRTLFKHIAHARGGTNSRKYLWRSVLAIIAVVIGYFTLDVVKTVWIFGQSVA